MISTELLEVLLRTVPQYFLFAILGLYIFGWIDKKPVFGFIAEAFALILGILSLYVLKSNLIPSPETEGINSLQMEELIKMLTMILFNGLFALIGIFIRIWKKKPLKYIGMIVFVISLIVFFKSTNNAKINFKLTPQSTAPTEFSE